MTDGLRQLRHGRQCADVNAGAHAVRTPEFDIVCVVMGLEEASSMIWSPGADAVIQAALCQRIHFLEPAGISRDLPVAKQLHDPAQLPVGGSVPTMIDWAFGDRSAKAHVATFIHGTHQLQFAKRPLPLRIEIRKGLGVIPDMSTGAFAAAVIWKAAFPSPQVAICLA